MRPATPSDSWSHGKKTYKHTQEKKITKRHSPKNKYQARQEPGDGPTRVEKCDIFGIWGSFGSFCCVPEIEEMPSRFCSFHVRPTSEIIRAQYIRLVFTVFISTWALLRSTTLPTAVWPVPSSTTTSLASRTFCGTNRHYMGIMRCVRWNGFRGGR